VRARVVPLPGARLRIHSPVIGAARPPRRRARARPEAAGADRLYAMRSSIWITVNFHLPARRSIWGELELGGSIFPLEARGSQNLDCCLDFDLAKER
jgi:hypothetical protein